MISEFLLSLTASLAYDLLKALAVRSLRREDLLRELRDEMRRQTPASQALQTVIKRHSGRKVVAIHGNVNHSVIIIGDGNQVPLADNSLLAQRWTMLGVYEACQNITLNLANDFCHGQPVIPREEIRTQLDAFLISSVRYGLLLGNSGTGKSIIMAVEAQRLLGNGWAVLLMRGRTFSLAYLAERVAQDGLGMHNVPDWRQIVVEPWKDDLPEGLRGLVLMIDAIDEAEPEELTAELLKLHDAIVGVDTTRLKVILSCRDLAWERLEPLLPFEREIGGNAPSSSGSMRVIEVGDFSELEVKHALEAIDATELLTPRQPGEWADPHVETLRELLKHPATFGLYAKVRASGSLPSIQDLTWSRLVEQHVKDSLRKVSARCHISLDSLRDWLIAWANLAWQQRARDFYLSRELIATTWPHLKVDINDPTESPFAALLEVGMLAQQSALGAKRLVGFRTADVGSYFLSLELERQSQDKPPQELRALADKWIREAFNYPPLIDALLAWIDRLADDPQNPRLLTLVEILVESHIFRSEVLFRMMRPAVINALFEIIRQKEPHVFYAYREAVKAVRLSQAEKAKIRRWLHDRDPKARRLAADLAGIHRDEEYIRDLIELLEDDDKEVRDAAYQALSQIGRPAVEPLLGIIQDSSQPVERRTRCLGALRAIGFRDERVSQTLEKALEDGLQGDTALLRSALLAAAHLRDRNQTRQAVAALESADWQVVQAAAKLLTEAPEPDALPSLRDTLHRWINAEQDDFGQLFTVRQLLVALAQIRDDQAKEIVLNAVREGLQDKSRLPAVEALRVADRLDSPTARRSMLEDLLRRVSETPLDPLVWHNVRRLGLTWRPEHLQALAETTKDLSKHGIDVAQRIVDAIIEGTRAKGDHPLGDYHAQLAAIRTLAKCRPDNFAGEAARLLHDAGWPLDLKVCDMLWVASDPAAEKALLRKLAQATSGGSGDQEAWLIRNHVIRALGTCGTERGASAVVDFLRSEPSILIYLPEEGVYPLVRRGVLRTEELVEIARDPHASSQGRITALIALGILDAQGHKDLFLEIMAQAEDPTLQAYAVRMLGFAEDSSVVPHLRQLLRKTQEPFVAEQAAEALARLEARHAIPDIEQALQEFAETDRVIGFIWALKHFREPSSLHVLTEVMQRSRSVATRHTVIEALGTFLPNAQAKQIILEQLDNWGGGSMDLGTQRPAIRALARYAPTLLLERALSLYDGGRLDRSAREELAMWLPNLANSNRVDQDPFVELATRLVCDLYLPIREQAAQSLGRVNPALCRDIYRKLRNATDEWKQACAVYMLGFCDGDEREIVSARFAEAFVIRYAADTALEMRHRRRALRRLVEQYTSRDGVERLAAYLAIQEQGDEQTIWSLENACRQDDLAYVFLRQLEAGVKERLEKERKTRAREEEKILRQAGTVRFD